MRISTQTLFETGAAQLGSLQSGLVKTHQQIASGRRILTPSDDPVAAARALEVSQSQSLNTQYGVNRQHAKSALGAVEGTLSSVTALLQDVKTNVIAAGNGWGWPTAAMQPATTCSPASRPRRLRFPRAPPAWCSTTATRGSD